MELSKNKMNVIIMYNMGYRIKDNICYNTNSEILKGYIGNNRYIRYGSNYGHFFGHQLVAYQKYGDKWLYSNLVVRHLDGNTLNNNEDNIAIGTVKDNYLDIPKETRIKMLASAQNSPLRKQNSKIQSRLKLGGCLDDVIRNIKKDITDGLSNKEISKKYNVLYQKIVDIKSGRTYKDVF